MISPDCIQKGCDNNFMFIDSLTNNLQCRTCTELQDVNTKFIKINTCLIMDNTTEISIVNMIRTLTSIEISENDGFTQEICVKCLEKLTNAYIFRTECIKTDTILRNSSNKIPSSTPIRCDDDVFDSLNLIDDNIQLANLEMCNLRDISHLSKEFNVLNGNTTNNSLTDISESLIYGCDEIDNLSSELLVPCDENNENNEQDSWKKYLKCVENTDNHVIKTSQNEKVSCDEQLSTKSENNNKKIHVPEKTLQTKKVEFVCDICGISFSSKYVYQKHKQRHSDKRNFNCSKCTKTFLSIDELKKHKLSHQGKKFMCEECGAKFTRKDSLKMHMKIHLNIKPHPCPYCDKRFLNTYNLQNHTRTHLQHSPYVCPTCNREFKQRTALKRHESIHRKENEKHSK